MSQSSGKIIGSIIGLALGRFRNLPLLLIGLFVGHLFDIGFFNDQPKAEKPDADAVPNNTEPDPYEILGVSRTASMATIEQAYRKKISDYHPDKVANAADEIKVLAERRARDINNAYDTIQKQRS